jgi:hypothetical protein
LARSAGLGFAFVAARFALRDGLRRKEGILIVSYAGLKACSTPLRPAVWSLRPLFGLTFCLT